MIIMRRLGDGVATASLALVLAACGSKGAAGHGGGSTCPVTSGKGVGHVIVIIQENHTFDNYFGRWCTAPAGSNPTCTAGPSCCEAAPQTEPTGSMPVVLDDAENGAYDPDHHQACEVSEIDMGKMDGFVMGPSCADPKNFAIATDAAAKPYHDLAAQYAVADRYFQPIAGQSSSNDMYFAVAKEEFIDNAFDPATTGGNCSLTPKMPPFMGQTTIADLLKAVSKEVAFYAEGFADMKAAGTVCPQAPTDCAFGLPAYPCVYDPGDVPFAYFQQHVDDPNFIRDFATLGMDITAGTLPDVVFVKGIGYHSEHPGSGDTIVDGTNFVTGVIQAVEKTCYKDDTLVLVTWDEGGGFFDHVAPPADSMVDMQPYGTRVPLLAIGAYAMKGAVSHVEMEHSSIVKFLEYNYLGGHTGQLAGRDAVVNNIGSLLDPAVVGETIPDQ
jgi:phospholipase C